MYSRRQALQLLALGVGSALNLGAAQKKEDARLTARPHKPAHSLSAGEHKLDFGSERDGFLYLPGGLRAEQPAPLLLMLHGATGRAANLRRYLSLADKYGTILLAADSRAVTWDVIVDGFGPDVAFLDRALQHTFDRCLVDPKRLAIGGFSDGASYALTLGLINGDLFSHVIAFSPGFMVEGKRAGKPNIFVSHGTQDRILPINRASRRLVPSLHDDSYKVRYEEFDGPHTVPENIAEQAFRWLVE